MINLDHMSLDELELLSKSVDNKIKRKGFDEYKKKIIKEEEKKWHLWYDSEKGIFIHYTPRTDNNFDLVQPFIFEATLRFGGAPNFGSNNWIYLKDGENVLYPMCSRYLLEMLQGVNIGKVLTKYGGFTSVWKFCTIGPHRSLRQNEPVFTSSYDEYNILQDNIGVNKINERVREWGI